MKASARMVIMMAVTVLVFSSCSIMCKKKSVLKDTKWSAEETEFIADVGNAKRVITLELLTDKDFRLTNMYVVPSHPAMYMNADGTVDVIPGHSSVYMEEGTYKFNGSKLVLTTTEGLKKEYEYRDGTLLGEGLPGSHVVFHRED